MSGKKIDTRCEKKQENITHSQEKRQSIETVFQMSQMMNFKTKILKQLLYVYV